MYSKPGLSVRHIKGEKNHNLDLRLNKDTIITSDKIGPSAKLACANAGSRPKGLLINASINGPSGSTQMDVQIA